MTGPLTTSWLPTNGTVAWLTGRQLFAKQRLYIAVGLAFVPTLIAGVYRITAADAAADGGGFLSTILREIVLSVLLPLTAVVFGTSAFGGEVDDGTLIYLMVKPIARWRVALSKYVVALAATLIVMLPGILFGWAATPGDVPFRVALGYGAGVTVGAVLYCAVFSTLGITSRRALGIGLVYIIAFENVLTRQVVGFKSFSVREMALAVSKQVLGPAGDITDTTITMGTVWTMGPIFFIAAMAIGVLILQRYEVAERL